MEDIGLLEMINCVKTTEQINILSQLFYKDLEIKLANHIPMTYESKYDIPIESKLSLLLESYHQLRLKDEKTNR